MTKVDKDEIREMLADVLATHSAEINGKFEVIRVELSQIKEQVLKTNGRVNKLEAKAETLALNDIEHVINCPLISRVKVIEDQEQYKKGQYRMITVISTVSATLAAIIISIAAIVLNKK